VNNISVNAIVLLVNGIPQSLLTVLALHVFSRTKLDARKYLLLALIFITATYLIRLLPIALGVNTVLSLFVLIIAFQFTYKTQLSKAIRIIASAVVAFMLIAVSEVLNILLLAMMYGYEKSRALVNSNNGLTQGISTIPTNVLLGVFILIGHLILRAAEKREMKDGEAGTKTGE